MTGAEIESRLRSYRADVARVACLKQQIEHDARALDRAKANALADDAAPVLRLDGMPHGKGGKSSVVEALIERYADGYTPPMIRDQARELDNKRRELDALELQTAFVPIWLDSLPRRERWVMERHEVDGLTWAEVAEASTEAFGFEMTEGGLRKIKRRALAKLEGVTA